MEDLIKKAKSGDKLAFTELMLQMQDELYKIAKIRLKMMMTFLMRSKRLCYLHINH